MNHVERFRAVMNFQPFDRLPQIEWAPYWDLTIARWQNEGLPDAADAFGIRRDFGLDPYLQVRMGAVNHRAPRTDGPGHPFVRNVDDYRAVRPIILEAHEATVDSLAAWRKRQDEGEVVIWISLDGFFWCPRTLLGIEPHLYAFYDHPELMHMINQDLADMHVRILRRLAGVCKPTFMTFAEDMSYNNGPMLSEAIFDEFLAPYYRQVVPVLKEMGTTIIVDSDGDVTQLMPWLLKVGCDGVLPLERQAGVDGALLRRNHPRLAMIGHYDKMVMPLGERAMRAEFDRLLPLARGGGFIFSVDHQTPPGVSLQQYRTYLQLLHEYSIRAAS